MILSLRTFPVVLLAATLLVTAPFEAAMAQGGPTVGTPGGASQTAPSNSEGFRAGGSGVVGSTQVAPSTGTVGTGTVRAAPQRQRRRQQARRTQPRPRAGAAVPAATAPVPGDASPATPVPGTVPMSRR